MLPEFVISFRLGIDSSGLMLAIKLFVVTCLVDLSLKLFSNIVVSVLYEGVLV